MMDGATKTSLNKPTDVKTWLRVVALRLLKEHPDDAPLDLGTRDPDQVAMMCIGALIEHAERLEARVEVLEDHLRCYRSPLDALREKAQRLAEMVGDLNDEPEGCIRHRLKELEKRAAWISGGNMLTVTHW